MIRKMFKKMFVFDLETSGLDFDNDRIIELGALYYELDTNLNKFVLKKEIDEFVKIDFKLSDTIIELTHITDEMLDNEGILEYDLFNLVNSLIDDQTLIIGYNVQFDLTFLQNMYKRYLNKDFIFKNTFLDVMAIYKDRYKYPHKLCNAIETFEIDIPNSHRAIDDIKATFEVLKSLLKEKNNIECYLNRFGFNPKFGISGYKLPQITYIAQYGAKLEIEKSFNK